MAVIKAVSSGASIGNAVNYVTKEEKTEEKLISGMDCNPQTAIDEMKVTKEIWGKNGGREYYHFVQSFSPEEKIMPEEAHTIAKELAEQRFKGYEVVIATHRDREHIHTHFIVNSVSHENGYKLHWSKYELQRMKDISDNLCMEHGKSICQKGQEITVYNQDKYKVLEKSIKGEYKSYVLDCYKAATAASQTAISREDFMEKMRAAGWKTTWTDRKYITFANMEGNKVRNSNLEKTFKEPFGKEDLQHGIHINLERANARRVTEQSRGLSADKGLDRETGGSPASDTDLAIAKLNATIGESKAAVSRDDSAKRERIAQEQSRQRERERAKSPAVHERSHESQGFER